MRKPVDRTGDFRPVRPCVPLVVRLSRLLARSSLMVVVVGASLLAPPSSAIAQTSDEVAAEVAEAKAQADAQEGAVREAQDALAGTLRDTYKAGVSDETAALGVILDTDATMENLIAYTQYSNSLTRQQEQAVREAQAAKSDLARQVDELASLQSELRAREDAMANRDSGRYHFCQWDGAWSSLPYWGGSIATDGCGLCSYTTMVDLLTGADYDPGEMLALRGDWAGQEEKLDWTNGTPNGMTHKEWTKATFDIDLSLVDNTVDACRKALREPETVLIIGPMGVSLHDKNGNWRYSNGHYICVYRCDDKGFYMHDSAYSGDAGTAVYYTDKEMADVLSTWWMVIKASN